MIFEAIEIEKPKSDTLFSVFTLLNVCHFYNFARINFYHPEKQKQITNLALCAQSATIAVVFTLENDPFSMGTFSAVPKKAAEKTNLFSLVKLLLRYYAI